MSGRLLAARLALFAALTFPPVAAFAVPPVIEYLFPAGGRLGSSILVSVGEKSNSWPVSVWTDTPGLVFTPAKTNGSFTALISPDTAPGPHLIRLYNGEGASPPRVFVAGLLSEIFEVEPNNSRARAQVVESLPVTINGRLGENGDVDSFAVKVEAGRWLVAQVDGFGLGSPIDPFLHLLDADGHQVAFANDTTTFDPLLAWKVEKSGSYTLQLAAFAYPPAADVRYAGKDSAVYRLTITDGPYVHHTFPAGAGRGRKTRLELFGWNLRETTGELDLTGRPAASDLFSFTAPGAVRPVRLAAGDFPEVMAKGGILQGASPLEVTPPCVINGRVDPAGTQNRYAFAAKKGERFEIRLLSAVLGFPLDGYLKVEDQAGNELAQNDDASEGLPDPLVVVTAPADGRCVACVSDLKHRGGPDYIYRLEIGRPEPRFSATVDHDAYVIEPGKTVDIKATVSRRNSEDKLRARIQGLPEGVMLEGGEIPKNSGEIKLTLKAGEKITPFNGPIQVVIFEPGRKPEREVLAKFDLKEKESPSDLLINETADLWLTVKLPVPAAEARPEKK